MSVAAGRQFAPRRCASSTVQIPNGVRFASPRRSEGEFNVRNLENGELERCFRMDVEVRDGGAAVAERRVHENLPHLVLPVQALPRPPRARRYSTTRASCSWARTTS